MPIYAFACERCGAHADVRASLAEKERGLAPTCPACGSPAMRRLMSTFATTGTAAAASAPAPAPAGGGCCGGGCCGGA